MIRAPDALCHHHHYPSDIPIWNHKTYLSKPIIVKGDGPIPHFRRYVLDHLHSFCS